MSEISIDENQINRRFRTLGKPLLFKSHLNTKSTFKPVIKYR
jgi:hypothetical protein